MTFKIGISQFYDQYESKHWKQTKSDIFPWGIFKSDSIEVFQ